MRNDTGETRADVLDAQAATVAAYPDSDKIGIFMGIRLKQYATVRRSSCVGYYDGETGEPSAS